MGSLLKLFTMFILSLVGATSAFACIDNGQDLVCRGDLVYPDSWEHSLGGDVIAINRRGRLVTIISNKSGNIFRFAPEVLSILEQGNNRDHRQSRDNRRARR